MGINSHNVSFGGVTEQNGTWLAVWVAITFKLIVQLRLIICHFIAEVVHGYKMIDDRDTISQMIFLTCDREFVNPTGRKTSLSAEEQKWTL